MSNKTFDITYIIPVLLGLAVHAATWKLMKSSVLYYSAMRITFIYQPQETSLCAMIRFLKRDEADRFSEEVLPSLSIGVCNSRPKTFTTPNLQFGVLGPDAQYHKPIPVPKDRLAFSLYQFFLKNWLGQYTFSDRICVLDTELSLKLLPITTFAPSQQLIPWTTSKIWGSKHQHSTARGYSQPLPTDSRQLPHRQPYLFGNCSAYFCDCKCTHHVYGKSRNAWLWLCNIL